MNWLQSLTLEQLLALYLLFWVVVGWVCMVWPRRRRPMATRRRDVLPAPWDGAIVRNWKQPN